LPNRYGNRKADWDRVLDVKGNDPWFVLNGVFNHQADTKVLADQLLDPGNVRHPVGNHLRLDPGIGTVGLQGSVVDVLVVKVDKAFVRQLLKGNRPAFSQGMV